VLSDVELLDQHGLEQPLSLVLSSPSVPVGPQGMAPDSSRRTLPKLLPVPFEQPAERGQGT
jgi:hypothetical protein